MAKIDVPFTSDAEIEQLVELFESCRLPYERWTHRSHLAVAFRNVQRYPFPDALERVRTGIQRYNNTQGDGTGYHETITVFYMQRAARAVQQQHPLHELVNDAATRWTMATLLEYYSPERLWCEAARTSWLEPDRRPLD